MDILEFTLSSSIEISIGGDFTKVDTLELHAPPAKEKKLPIRLRKGFMKAAMSFADKGNASEGTEKDLKGSDIEGLMFAADVDVEKYMDDFAALMLVHGVCKVADEKFLKTHWDKVSAEDAMRLMGEYLAHFFAPSWLPKETTKD